MMSNLGIISKREARQYQKSISQHWEPFPLPPSRSVDDAQDEACWNFESQD